MIDNSVKIEVQVLPEMHRVKVGKQYLHLDRSGYYDFVDEGSYEEDEYLLTIDEVKDAEKDLGIEGLQKKWYEAE